MSKLHYNNKKGKLERCRDKTGKCPFGGAIAQTLTRGGGGYDTTLPLATMGLQTTATKKALEKVSVERGLSLYQPKEPYGKSSHPAGSKTFCGYKDYSGVYDYPVLSPKKARETLGELTFLTGDNEMESYDQRISQFQELLYTDLSESIKLVSSFMAENKKGVISEEDKERLRENRVLVQSNLVYIINEEGHRELILDNPHNQMGECYQYLGTILRELQGYDSSVIFQALELDPKNCDRDNIFMEGLWFSDACEIAVEECELAGDNRNKDNIIEEVPPSQETIAFMNRKDIMDTLPRKWDEYDENSITLNKLYKTYMSSTCQVDSFFFTTLGEEEVTSVEAKKRGATNKAQEKFLLLKAIIEGETIEYFNWFIN